MKTQTLALALLLVACGGNDSTDSAPAEDSGAAARLLPDAPSLSAERAEAVPLADRTVEGDRGQTRGLTAQRTGSGPAALQTRPRGSVEASDVNEAAPPRLAPLPTNPLDDALSVLIIATDNGADGTVDRTQRSTFDSASLRIMLEEDRDGDGVFEQVQAFAHFTDDQNRVIRIETDNGADGTVDSTEVRIFGDNGRVLRVEHDNDADGTPDRVESNTWNAEGRKTEWAVDETNDGKIDMVQRWDFTVAGKSDARSLQRYVDGALQRTTLYDNAYGADGKLVSTTVDLQGDGTNTNVIGRSYDAKGRIASTRSDIGGDGTVDNTTTYLYDDEGRLSVLEIDTGADGTPDTRITRTYEGFRPNDCFGR